MKFISKLYFNIFKNTGNLRLLFVIGCVFAFISLLIITPEAKNKMYFYKVHTSLRPWEYYKLQEVKNNYYISDADLKKIETLILRSDCENSKVKLVSVDDNTQGDCKIIGKEYNNLSKVYIYSLSYLWNYLWVIFWFYLPFILVLPIKFIIDGYKQDRNTNRVKK